MIGAALLLAAQQVTNMIPVERQIDPKHRIVEGVASDGTTVWVSSVIDRQILACPAVHTLKPRPCRTLTTLAAGLHPFAIAWDASRKRLWVAGDCPPGVAAIKPCDRGALMAFNRGGRVMTRIAPTSGSFHPGDVSASAAGVFVSDSQNGAVYQLSKTGFGLETLIVPGIGKSAQGTAADAEGATLIVADYSQGIGVVDLASGTRTLLPRQDGKPLRGVDGLTRCGSTFYGIYNGSDDGMLLAIRRTETGITFKKATDSGFRDPTQVAFDGKRLLVVVNSGWASVGKAEPRAEGATILAVPLTADCEPDFR